MLSFALQGGSASTVTLTCSGAPPHGACNAIPQSLALEGANAASATVTVTTAAGSVVAPRVRLEPRAPLGGFGSEVSNLKFQTLPLPTSGILNFESCVRGLPPAQAASSGSQISNLRFQIPLPSPGILNSESWVRGLPPAQAASSGSQISNLRFQIPFPSSGNLNSEAWVRGLALALGIALFSLAALARLRALVPDPASQGPSRGRLSPPHSRRPLRLSFVALLLSLLFSWPACGGGGSNDIIHNPGTPRGDSQVTITATTTSGSNRVAHTISLSLKVS